MIYHFKNKRMTKYFTHPIDGRTIEVKLNKEDDFVEFSFKDGMTFYDITLSEWQGEYPYWQDHLRMKNWFTPDMEKFINDNSKS